MTTNYYLWAGICRCCGRPEKIYHIGLSAVGWQFLFQAYNFSEGESPHIHNIEDWKALLFNKNYKIYDEYEHEHPIEEFWGFIQNKQKEGRSHVLEYGIRDDEWVDDQGYNFSLRDFS